jgi:hypothetical protein
MIVAETPPNAETPSNQDTGGNMLTGEATPESSEPKKKSFGDTLREAAKGTGFEGIMNLIAKIFEGKTESTTQVTDENQPESPTTPTVAGTEQRPPAVTQGQQPVVPPQEMGEVPNISTPQNPLFGSPEASTSSTTVAAQNAEPLWLVKGEKGYEERNNPIPAERQPVGDNMRSINQALDGRDFVPAKGITMPSGTPPTLAEPVIPSQAPAPQPTPDKSNALW